jgi:hypothetical protein
MAFAVEGGLVGLGMTLACGLVGDRMEDNGDAAGPTALGMTMGR